MDNLNNSAFDMISVNIKDQLMQARPIEWDSEPADGVGNNKKGNQLIPTKYATTCPFCGQLITFGPDDVYDYNNIKCTSCKAHKQPTMPITIAAEIDNAFETNVVSETNVKQNPFIDPIAKGLIDISNYEL